MAGNTLQSNPSDATDSFEQPDWNSANGHGVEPSDPVDFSFSDNYEAQRASAQERADATQSYVMAGDNTEDEE